MKLKLTLLTLVGLLLLVTTQPLAAITSSLTPVSAEMIEKQKTDLKHEFKAKSRQNKVERLLQKAGIDFKDPIRKWMWYCLISIAAAAAFFLLLLASPSVLFGILLNIALLAALVTGIIFLVKNNS